LKGPEKKTQVLDANRRRGVEPWMQKLRGNDPKKRVPGLGRKGKTVRFVGKKTQTRDKGVVKYELGGGPEMERKFRGEEYRKTGGVTDRGNSDPRRTQRRKCGAKPKGRTNTVYRPEKKKKP